MNTAQKLNTTFATTPAGQMRKRQAPLRTQYVERPSNAEVIDWAKTSSTEVPASCALATTVTVDKHNPTAVPIGVHTAVGGLSDAPTPGDLLCGALAACLDSTIRIVANLLAFELTELSVEVCGTVDVRGALMMTDTVPTGFQSFDVRVTLMTTQGINDKQITMLLQAAERSCIIMQTLKANSQIKIAITRN